MQAKHATEKTAPKKTGEAENAKRPDEKSKRKSTDSQPSNSEKTSNPSAHFDSPDEVAKSKLLSQADKVKALKKWEEDARIMSVAAEEGMGGGEPSRLDEVSEAQVEINAPSQKSKRPTKAG